MSINIIVISYAEFMTLMSMLKGPADMNLKSLEKHEMRSLLLKF